MNFKQVFVKLCENSEETCKNVQKNLAKRLKILRKNVSEFLKTFELIFRKCWKREVYLVKFYTKLFAISKSWECFEKMLNRFLTNF